MGQKDESQNGGDNKKSILSEPILSVTERIAYTTLHEISQSHLSSWCSNFVGTEFWAVET